MDNLTAGNPVAHRVRVYYAGTSTIAEGMPVCYEHDSTTNWFGGSVTDGVVTASTTTAEGLHNKGKYIRVVDPTIHNLEHFAGVVTKGGWCGKTGGLKVLDIYVPNGAIVPVKTVLAATVRGRTILSINSGTLTFGNPTSDMPRTGSTAGTIASRAVAVAQETISAAGLVLAKLDPGMFIYQGCQIGAELYAGYVGDVQTAVNTMNVEFAQTDNDANLLHCRALLSGTCQSDEGVYRFETNITGIQSGSVYGLMVQMNVGSASTQACGGVFIPLRVKFNCRALDPSLVGLGYIALTQYEWAMSLAADNAALTNPPALRPWHRYMSYYASPTHFLYVNSIAEFGGHIATGTPTPAAAGDVLIPIRVGGNDYWVIGLVNDPG